MMPCFDRLWALIAVCSSVEKHLLDMLICLTSEFINVAFMAISLNIDGIDGNIRSINVLRKFTIGELYLPVAGIVVQLVLINLLIYFFPEIFIQHVQQRHPVC
jgi:hypothetical protein